MSSRFLIIPIILAALTSACGNKQVSQDELAKEPPPTPAPSFSLSNLNYVIYFEQGQPGEHDIYKFARVEKGSPVLSVQNLPETATFDGRILKWTPPCDLDPSFFVNGQFGVHVVLFNLKSDAGGDDFIERDVGLGVFRFQDFGGDRPCEEIQP